MPDLESYEKRLVREAEKAEKKNAEKKEAALRKHRNTMVTVGKLEEILDRFDHVYVAPLRDQLTWLMRPFYQRWYGMTKAWLQDQPKRIVGAWLWFKGRRAERQRIQKIRRMERLDRKEHGKTGTGAPEDSR